MRTLALSLIAFVLALPLRGQSGCAWTSRAPMPTARCTGAAGVANVNGRLVVAGHHEGNPGSGRIVEIFDVATNSWQTGTPHPRVEGRQGLNANAVVGNAAYFFGGSNIFNNFVTRNVDQYDPFTDTWTLDVAQYPLPVANLGTVTFNGRIYCFGGEPYGGHAYTLAARFDPVARNFFILPSLPVARSRPGVVVKDGRIWVIGGYDYDPARGVRDILTSIDILDPLTNTWSSGPSLPVVANVYAAGVVNGDIFVLLEDSNRGVYQLRNNTWTRVCDGPPAQSSNYAGLFAGDQLHAIGGCDPKLTTHTALQVRGGSAPPVLQLPGPITAEATSASGAAVQYTATATDDRDGTIAPLCVPASGSMFGLGASVVSCVATDSDGNQASGSFPVTVVDTTAPTITSVTPSLAKLNPPNHKMVPIEVRVVAADAVDVTLTARIVSVTSSEPDEGTGDGATNGDIRITGPLTVELRAERDGRGPGRVYTITVEVIDDSGNRATAQTTVTVPK